jgi:hypothetical protein
LHALLPKANAGADFASLNMRLQGCSALGNLFVWTKIPTAWGWTVRDVLLADRGVYALHAEHYHAEDMDYEDAEGIPHYVAVNMSTRVMCLYPEILCIMEHDREDLESFYEKLRAPPFLLRLPPLHHSANKFVRRLAFEVCEGAAQLPLCPALRGLVAQ